MIAAKIDLDPIRSDRGAMVRVLGEAGAVLRGNSCRCPLHEDRNASAGIFEDGGVWRFRCFVCDVTEDAIGLRQKIHGGDFKQAVEALGGDVHTAPVAPSKNNGNAKPARTFPTVEAAAADFARWKGGNVETIHRWADDWHRARIRIGDGKTFVEITKNGTGWRLKGPEKPHRLYRIDEVPDDGMVYVVEGEKAADAGWSIGLPCTTSGSSSSARGADWSHLAGRDVPILPDNDPAGEKYAADVTKTLLALNPPARVRIVRMDGRPPGGDLADLLAGCTDDDDRAGLRQLVETMAEQAEPETAPEEQAAPEATLPIECNLTDTGNAERLAHRHGDAIRYTEGLGFLVNTGKHWENDKTGNVHRLAIGTVRGMVDEAQRLAGEQRLKLIEHSLKCESAARIEAMLSLAKRLSPIAIADDDLDRDAWLFNTLSGTIEIARQSGEHRHREHRPRDLITKIARVRYDPRAECPCFLRFLGEVLKGDDDNSTAAMIAFAQRVFGSCLIGEPEEILHVLYGIGENGKTTLLLLMFSILGDYAVTLPQKFLAERMTEAVPTDTLDLRGARLAVSQEPDQRMTLDEAKVKYLTGRDTVKARKLYHDYVEFSPTHKLFLVTNHRPVVKSQTRAIWRRIALWPFMYVVPPEKKDRMLGDKMAAEASGVLNWMLEGARQWVLKGRTSDPPKSVTEATQEYRREEDAIGDWIAECTKPEPTRTAFGDLYASYEAWSKAAGFEKPLSRKAISRMLEERGLRRHTLHGGKVFEGIAVRTPDLFDGGQGDVG